MKLLSIFLRLESFKVYSILALTGFTCFSISHAIASEVPYTNSTSDNLLVVGVRDSADPFSYQSASRAKSQILQGYSGYMVEICRRVITELVKDTYFEGNTIITKIVKAKDRFEMLDTYSVDMLCGPDSITQQRLETYNASHPVFLSGIALVSRPAADFPRTKYCKGIVGMVEGTTSAQAGLERMAEFDDVRRFRSAIVSFLAQHGTKLNTEDRFSFDFHLKNWLNSHGDEGVPNIHAGEGSSPIPSKSVTTDECMNGYSHGPIIFFDNHDLGVEAFCNGDILFYLGDVDLLKKKFDSRPACERVFQRTTLTREAYGIYFRKSSSEYNVQLAQQDAMLYARFNNILLRMMQNTESILDDEYKQQFGDQRKGSDLTDFFNSFKYANQY